ncbi:MAG: hypothetical protein HY347_08885 [candidate division NC10 bacterium]|nr:hypothetical protein [candidate division NC10 bacterium]
MARYHGNDRVKVGFYWNPSQWEIITIPKGGGVLPGGDDLRYVRLPLPLVMLLGPLMGALYVVFLPFIGFAMVFGFAGRKLLLLARRTVGNLLAGPEAAPKEEG